MHYITACLKIISDKDLNEIMKEFKTLEEIWENEEAVKAHFTKKHTKDVQKQQLTEVEWLMKSNVKD
ncbi:antibiotic biosynthesis monooxygenase [Bacillus haynesii]|nr:antibiotic biosynthesis monooxygenase [Bacillus haynesii]